MEPHPDPDESTERKPNNRRTERKAAPHGNNLWLALILLSIAVVIPWVYSMAANARYPMAYSDLLKLIAAGENGSIVVQEQHGSNLREVTYSGLRDLAATHPIRVGELEIIGKVKRTTDPSDKGRPANTTVTPTTPASTTPSSTDKAAPESSDKSAPVPPAKTSPTETTATEKSTAEKAAPAGASDAPGATPTPPPAAPNSAAPTATSAATRKTETVYFVVQRLGLAEDREIFARLQTAGLRFQGEEAPAWWVSAWGIPLLLWLPIGVLLVLLLRKVFGGNSPIAFGRSRGKMYAQEDVGNSFGDVAGIDEAVDELREVVEFLRSPEKYQNARWPHPEGRAARGAAGHR